MRLRPPLAVAAILGVVTGVAGCGAAAPSPEDSSIVASFYPWAWLSRQIAGDTMSVQDLTGSGTDPHDLELSARQIVAIERAKLVVYVKGMQPAVDEAVAQHAADHAVEAGSVADALPAPDTTAATSEPEPSHEGDGGHDNAGSDPHIWLDPMRFAAVAKKVGDRMADLDPGHADQYRHRAERLERTLGELDQAYRSGLRACRSRTLVTSHASFAYLADRYDLEQVGVAGLDPHVPPSPTRLVEVARLIEERDVKVVFLERLASPKAAKTVARETGARTAVLDPIAGLRPGSSDDYLSLMRANLSTLVESLGCP